MAFCKLLLSDGTSRLLLSDGVSVLLLMDDTCGGDQVDPNSLHTYKVGPRFPFTPPMRAAYEELDRQTTRPPGRSGYRVPFRDNEEDGG